MASTVNQPALRGFVGVDVGPDRIRAGAFTGTWKLAGRVKRSTKLERGSEVVLERISRFIREAADEADLPFEAVVAAGVGLPGELDPGTGQLQLEPAVGRSEQEVQRRLEELLARPIIVGDRWQFATLGIYEEEWEAKPTTFGALFPGAEIRGAVLTRESSDGRALPTMISLGLPTDPSTKAELSPGGLSGKALRKAARRGEPEAQAALRRMAEQTGIAMAAMIRGHHPQAISLGGNLAEDFRGDLMDVLLATCARHLPSGTAPVMPTISKIGDDASVVGAAILGAARQGVERSASDTRLLSRSVES